jgi:hypothetical protein
MVHQEFNYIPVYTVGPSSGTTAVTQFRLGDEDTLIGIENVAMLGKVSLRAAPRQAPILKDGRVQPGVAVSLERSLKEHADVWAELAKY